MIRIGIDDALVWPAAALVIILGAYYLLAAVDIIKRWRER